ncbi:hypothetical protein C8R45DRAFT_928023 [Mycena sanguinolenta]|nr:hypothetical protein C8R45DRAFT_928023 [Mycena sanguinolenta]
MITAPSTSPFGVRGLYPHPLEWETEEARERVFAALVSVGGSGGIDGEEREFHEYCSGTGVWALKSGAPCTFASLRSRARESIESNLEHRLAFLRHATKLTSAQIFASSSPSSSSVLFTVCPRAKPKSTPASFPARTTPQQPPQPAQTLFSGATPTHVPQTLFSGATMFGSVPSLPQNQPQAQQPVGGTSIFGTSAPVAPTTSIFGNSSPAPALSTPVAALFSFGSAALLPRHPQRQRMRSLNNNSNKGSSSRSARLPSAVGRVLVWREAVLSGCSERMNGINRVTVGRGREQIWIRETKVKSTAGKIQKFKPTKACGMSSGGVEPPLPPGLSILYMTDPSWRLSRSDSECQLWVSGISLR